MAEMDPRLVRIMARHYTDAQGLRYIAIAVSCQAGAEVWFATGSDGLTLLSAPPLFAVFFVLIRVVDRYYSRFGRVILPGPPGWVRMLTIVLITVLLPLPSSRLPNIVWTLLSAVPLWLAWDCRPYRWHQLLVCVAMIYVAFGRIAYPEAGDLAWMAPRIWAWTSALVIAGLLDHRLFVRTMRQTRVPAAEPS
jgi:hypothetical protein